MGCWGTAILLDCFFSRSLFYDAHVYKTAWHRWRWSSKLYSTTAICRPSEFYSPVLRVPCCSSHFQWFHLNPPSLSGCMAKTVPLIVSVISTLDSIFWRPECVWQQWNSAVLWSRAPQRAPDMPAPRVSQHELISHRSLAKPPLLQPPGAALRPCLGPRPQLPCSSKRGRQLVRARRCGAAAGWAAPPLSPELSSAGGQGRAAAFPARPSRAAPAAARSAPPGWVRRRPRRPTASYLGRIEAGQQGQ